MSEKVDVVIIGAGPGGYPAAIRAAQLDKQVVLIEKGFIGGECLNWGCIPSKALISASKFYHKIEHDAKKMGIHVTSSSIDISKMQKWKENIQEKLISGVKQLLKAHKITTVMGTASFLNRNQIEVKLNEGGSEQISFDNAIIATGSTFLSLPGVEIDEVDILSAKGALALEEVPNELVCIGGGIVGLELGIVWAKLGSKVTIVELLPNILTGVEKRLVTTLKRKLRDLGVEVLTDAKTTNIEKNKKLTLTMEHEGKEKTLTADKVLLSIGKQASTDILGLEKVGVTTDERGFIKIDNNLRTNVSNIYAVGDCTGEPFLAHRATKQGIIAAEVIAGLPSEADWRSVPTAIFTDPEIAYAGLSEQEARDLGYDVLVGHASFGVSGRAMSQLETDGFVRVITDENNGVLLGAEIVGPHATDLISEIAFALEMGATVEDIGFTIHPHPTLPEMIMEAAESAEGKAIHVPNRGKQSKKS